MNKSHFLFTLTFTLWIVMLIQFDVTNKRITKLENQKPATKVIKEVKTVYALPALPGLGAPTI